MKILFIVSASPKVGLGHLNRCMAIADYASVKNFEVFFLLSACQEFAEQVRICGYKYQLIDEDISIANQILALKGIFDIVIADVIFGGFRSIPFATETLSLMGEIAQVSIAIDALGIDSINKSFLDINATHLLIPYASSVRITRKTKFKVLSGPQFVILPVKFQEIVSRRASIGSGKSILVTCGGSDQNENTLEILNGLEAVDEILKISVIVGPLFSQTLISKIRSSITLSKHRIDLVDSPKSLLAHMLDVDFAISASGLTKYELAAIGVPAILFSIDEAHHIVNQSFVELGTCIDLGLDLSKSTIKDAATFLIHEHNIRKSMSNAGKSLIDGKGIERFFKEILEM